MAEDYSNIEALLNLSPGSTANITPNVATPILVKGVESKTKELVKQLDKSNTLISLPSAELVKNGIDIDQLEADRSLIRVESYEVYRIGKALLTKIYEDIKDQIGVSDKMYIACSKMLDSVNNSLIRLFDMNQKLRQDEEFKSIASSQVEDNNKTKMMTTDSWIEWIENNGGTNVDAKQLIDTSSPVTIIDAELKE